MPEEADEDAYYSPDGLEFAFTSKRSGVYEIWVSDANGSNQHAVTSEGVFCGSAVWSPDRSEIAFDSRISGKSEIWIVSSKGGKPRPLLEQRLSSLAPYWSHDGQWIYFCRESQIWKARARGGGEPVQVTRSLGFDPRESPDGKYLYYSNYRKLWRLPLGGGGEQPMPEVPIPAGFRYWDVSEKGIFFLSDQPKPMVRFLDMETRAVRDVVAPPGPPAAGWRGLSAAADGKSLLWVQYDMDRQEIVVVDGVR